MKNNYPIKYALMPIYEFKNWNHNINELEKNYEIVCYIVSKCYFIGQKIRYKENGSISHEYEVVFPYQMKNFNTFSITNPTFNYFDNECINSTMVDILFDTYEDALKYATEKNDELCEQSCPLLPFSKDMIKKIENKKDEFKKILLKYKLLEQKILKNTQDINNTNRKKLDKILKLNNNGKNSLFNLTLYEVMKLFSNSKYVVYSLSKEQYDKLLEAVSDNDYNSIKSIVESSSIILVHEKDNNEVKIINSDKTCSSYINNNNELDYCDNFDLNNFDLSDNSLEVFYTTETLEDILSTYKVYEDINITQRPILKKHNN